MSVFNSVYADQYDNFYAEKDYGAECDLVEAALKKYATAPVKALLDVGCGTGGHAIMLGRRGYAATGVDLSPHMLERAQAKANALQFADTPQWLRGDARDFSAGKTFDAAIMMFAVIGYLTDNADVLTGLRNIRKHLRPGAVFLCDFWYGPSVLAVRPSDRVRVLDLPDGEVIRMTTTQLNPVQHTADVTFRLWTMHGDQIRNRSREMHRLRYFFPQEFSLLLSQAGFAMESISAFPSLDAPLNDQTWNAFVVARAE
jgi:SAM-dependent methyltransferase